MPMINPNARFVAPVSDKIKILTSKLSEDAYKEYMEHFNKIRKAMLSFFHVEKLPSLFIKAVDSIPYVSFASERDRRVNRTMPTYKLKIDFAKLGPELAKAIEYKNMRDVKTSIIHGSVLQEYLTLLMKAAADRDLTYIKDDAPPKEDMEELLDMISTSYIVHSGDAPEDPIFVRQFI